MAKKNSSKYNRYEKQMNMIKNNNNKKNNVDNSSKTIEIEDLDSTKNLDISFVEGKFNKKAIEQKTEILDIDEIAKANAEFKESLEVRNQKRRIWVLVWLLMFACLFLLLFIIYHFCTIDHNKEKIVEKEVIKEVKVVDDNYLFLGDSITEQYHLDKFYEDLPVVNSGISGYTTSAILKRMNDMVYQYNPSKVFLLIGTNDLELKVSNEDIVNNIKEIVKNIKANRPYAKIYIESIYPINNSNDDKISNDVVNGNRRNEDIIVINKELEKFAKEEKITYINIYDELIDDDGLLKLDYTIDGLHLTDEGYKKVTEVLMDYIKK